MCDDFNEIKISESENGLFHLYCIICVSYECGMMSRIDAVPCVAVVCIAFPFEELPSIDVTGIWFSRFAQTGTHTLAAHIFHPFIHSLAQPTGLCATKTLNFFSGSIDLLNVASARHAVLVKFCQSLFFTRCKNKIKENRKVERRNYFYHPNYYSESELLSTDRKRAKERERDVLILKVPRPIFIDIPM